MNRNVWLLFCCQAMLNAVVAAQFVMAALIGHSLAGSKALDTLPMGVQMTAVMAGSIPAGIVFSRLGRRPGFWLGAGMSFVGSLIFALGLWWHSFALYCVGAVPAGLGFGISQHLRFAAAEVAAAEARARAIALVMAGGIIAAVLGPEIVKTSMAAIPSIPFLATYLALLVLPLVAAGLLAITRLPPAPPRVAQHLPLRDILARPAFRAAVAAGMVGYGAMSLVMTATPLQMSFCGLAVGASADVVAAHSVAMFLPGFATGRLIDRFGTHPIICAGAILIAVCVAIDIAFAPLLDTFYAALILLGAGWNFMFVGGTALLAEAHDADERVRVQATNDFIVFGTAAAASFASGAIEAIGGWSSLNLSVVPPLLVAVAIVSWHWTARERLAPVG